MRDKLKDFVELNRDAFDSAAAPQVFAAVQTALATKKVIVSSKLSKLMIKFTLGTTIVVGAGIVAVQLFKAPVSGHKTEVASSTTGIEPQSLTAQIVENTPQFEQKTKVLFTSINNDTSHKQATPPAIVANGEDSLQSVAALPQYQEKLLQVNTDELSNDTVFSGIKKLLVEVEYCNVEILRSSDANVKLQAEIVECSNSVVSIGRKQYSKSITKLGYEVKDEKLRVYTDVQVTKERRQVEGNKMSKIRLLVPDNLQIEIVDASGSVLAEGINASTIRLEANFGSITASNIKAEISMNASSGSIKAQNIEGSTRVKTEFGSIKLDHIIGNCNVNSSSGSVFVNDVEGALEVRSNFGSQKISNVKGTVKSISSSGSVKMVKVTGDVNCTSSFGSQTYDELVGNITAQSSSGSIQLNVFRGNLNLTTSFGGIKGDKIVLTGDAVLKASSGSIHLELLNDADDLRYDLSSSSGNITVEQNGTKLTGKDDLKIGSGKWVINGVTTFGSQSYRLVKLP